MRRFASARGTSPREALRLGGGNRTRWQGTLQDGIHRAVAVDVHQAAIPVQELRGRPSRHVPHSRKSRGDWSERADILLPREAENAADVGFQEGAHQVVPRSAKRPINREMSARSSMLQIASRSDPRSMCV